MKETFLNLKEPKKTRIIEACFDIFSRFGYERTSTDRIIAAAGISKGGLYEYVDSKKELFLFLADYAFGEIYGHLNSRIREEGRKLPSDILERFWHTTQLAADFYLAHPSMIRFVVMTDGIREPVLRAAIDELFRGHFEPLFERFDARALRFAPGKVLDLIHWLLVKTRMDFLHALDSDTDPVLVKRHYFEKWEFYLSVLREGIYKKKRPR